MNTLADMVLPRTCDVSEPESDRVWRVIEDNPLQLRPVAVSEFAPLWMIVKLLPVAINGEEDRIVADVTKDDARVPDGD
jgi:hypothetical protein